MPSPLRFFDRGSGLILLLAALTGALTGPGQTIGVSVFIDHLVDDLSLSRTAVSTAYLIGTMSGALLLPIVGQLIDRRGVRLAQALLGVAFAVALINMSLVQGFVWLALGFAGIRWMGQGSLSLVSTVTVTLAFTERRGTALGIRSAMVGAGLAISPLLLVLVINGFGWRTAWVVAAVVTLVTVVPIGWFGLRSLPTGSAGRRVDDRDPQDNSVTRADALRTRGFWVLAAVSGCAGMFSTALNFHQIDMLTSAGLSETAAAALFLPQILGATTGGLVTGWLSDRWGTRHLPSIAMLVLACAMWLASAVSPGVVVFVYALTLGIAGGTVGTATSLLIPTWFGTRALGSIQGTLTLFNSAAAALGPLALALAQQSFSAYAPAVLLLSAAPVAVIAFTLVSMPSLERARVARSGS